MYRRIAFGCDLNSKEFNNKGNYVKMRKLDMLGSLIKQTLLSVFLIVISSILTGCGSSYNGCLFGSFEANDVSINSGGVPFVKYLTPDKEPLIEEVIDEAKTSDSEIGTEVSEKED